MLRISLLRLAFSLQLPCVFLVAFRISDSSVLLRLHFSSQALIFGFMSWLGMRRIGGWGLHGNGLRRGTRGFAVLEAGLHALAVLFKLYAVHFSRFSSSNLATTSHPSNYELNLNAIATALCCVQAVFPEQDESFSHDYCEHVSIY